MIRGFWQSKLTVAAIAALTVAVAAAVWVRNRAYPVYIPIVASVLVLAIGLILARLLGSIVANLQNTRVMSLLHVDLQPEKFVAKYARVPAALPKNSKSYVLACAYLADGYAAAGRFDEAEAALCEPERAGFGDDAALQALYYNNLCAYALGAGKLPAAREAADRLLQVLTGARAQNPALADNMAAREKLYRNHIAAMRSQHVDRTWLEQQLNGSHFLLHRLELAQVLAIAARNYNDSAAEAQYLAMLEKEGGATWYPAWARAQRQAHS